MILREILEGKTPRQKLRILYRINERLRLQHNTRGDEYRNGQISEEEWAAYLETFHRRQKKVLNRTHAIRTNLGLVSDDTKVTEDILAVKLEGKEATDLDPGVDIDVIED